MWLPARYPQCTAPGSAWWQAFAVYDVTIGRITTLRVGTPPEPERRAYLFPLAVATIQRSGKGALCSILKILMTGTNASAAQYSANAEEFRKALLPYVSRGQPIVRLDNVDDGSELSSPHLASALTEGWYCDRVLGSSELRSVPVRSVFAFTGNNCTVSKDLLFRTLWIRLTPETDRPDKRDFAIDGIEDHVRMHRAEYLTALATMVEHWKAKGAKPWTGRRWNSFNPFVRAIGGVLEACGIQGFLGNAEEQIAAGNPAEEEWRRVLQCWYEKTDESKPASWLLENVCAKCEPLAYIRIRGRDDTGRARSLSRLLGKQAGTPRSLTDGTIVFIRKDRDPHSKVNAYGLVARPDSDACGHDGGAETLSPHLARNASPCGASARGQSGHSGHNLHPVGIKPTITTRVEGDRKTNKGRELSPLCPLYPPALEEQGVTTRVECGDSGDTASGARRPPRPTDTPAALSADQSYEFEERISIMMFDGGLTREEAERLARAEMRGEKEM